MASRRAILLLWFLSFNPKRPGGWTRWPEKCSKPCEALPRRVKSSWAAEWPCSTRDTRDLDAWWDSAPQPDTERLLAETVRAVGEQHGLTLRVRRWGETQSFELLDSQRTVFGFQIAVRTQELVPPLPSAWPPVKIETFLDNVGAKMNAVVSRGAPRDLLDAHEVVRRGLTCVEDLWRAWQDKNPAASQAEAHVSVLRHLELLEQRRPLAAIDNHLERERAHEVRHWVRAKLCGKGPA